jgi:hypothetical protein
MQEGDMNDWGMLGIALLFAVSAWLLILLSDALMGESHEGK